MDMDIEVQVADEVRHLIALLMQRPITEATALEIAEHARFAGLEIEDSQWVGFDEDEAMGGEDHGWLETLLLIAFGQWAISRKAGRVYPGDTSFILRGTRYDIKLERKPDIAFVRSERVLPGEGFMEGAPDAAVEIISPTDKPRNIRRKLRDYLTHGVMQVWQVYPHDEEIVVNYPDGTARTFRIGDVISGLNVMPGFELDVTALFERNEG